MAMFPQFAGAAGGPPAPGGSSGLLSFKAGKMEVADKGNDVYHITPNLRKGTISLFKGLDDQLMHFSWKERPSGTVVDDIIILAEEAVYKKVNTGTEGDRVYLMEIAGNRRFFYWMQDKNPEKDEENMKKVNELTNSPPPDPVPGSRGGSSFSPEVMNLLGNMGAGPVTPGLGGSLGASSSGSNPSEQGLNIQNLQSILQNMGFSPQEQAQAAGSISLSPAGNTASTPPGEPAAPASGAAEASTTVSNPASGTGNPGGGASGETNPSGEGGGEDESDDNDSSVPEGDQKEEGDAGAQDGPQ